MSVYFREKDFPCPRPHAIPKNIGDGQEDISFTALAQRQNERF